MNLQTSPADLNSAAQDLARAAIAKEIPEREARLAIAGLIEQAQVPAHVAREQRDITERTRQELTSRLSDMLVGRATGTGGFSQSLNLEMIAGGAEATAWARQLLRLGARSKLRNLRDADHRSPLVSPLHETEVTDAATYHFHTAAGSPSAADTLDEQYFTEQLEALEEGKNLRSDGQMRLSARNLRTAYSITAPIVVPEAITDRDFVIAALKKDTMLAYASVNAWLALFDGVQSTIDERILGLWDDFTVDQVEDLSENRPAFAHTLALAAVLYAPKPSRDDLKQAIHIASMAAPGQAWEDNAAALVESWVARECAPFSEFKAKSKGDEEEVLAARQAAAEAWPTIAEATAGWHKTPFGDSEDSVAEFVARIFRGINPANFGE